MIVYRCRCEQNQFHLCPGFHFKFHAVTFDQPHCPYQTHQSLLPDDYLCAPITIFVGPGATAFFVPLSCELLDT